MMWLQHASSPTLCQQFDTAGIATADYIHVVYDSLGKYYFHFTEFTHTLCFE
jgi:hypothetical protein